MYSKDERREPLRELLREALPEQDAATNEEMAALSGTQLRDRLIAHRPLDTPWIKRVNQARISSFSAESLSLPVHTCRRALAIMLQRRRPTLSGAEPCDALIFAVVWAAVCTAPGIGPLCFLKSANLTLHLLQQSIMLACWGFGIAVVIGDCIHHAVHCILRQRQSSGRGARGIGLAGATKFWASTAVGSSGSWKWPSPLGRSSEPLWHFNFSTCKAAMPTAHTSSSLALLRPDALRAFVCCLH